MSKILPAQIQKIKIAQKQLGIDNVTYRIMLSSFDGAKSCTQLNSKQADELLSKFENSGWKPKTQKLKAKGKKKYSEFDNRLGDRATGAQMRLIEALWMTNARIKTEAALFAFIEKMTKKSHITFISKNDVKVLKMAIERFGSAQRPAKNDSAQRNARRKSEV